jgi:hypothetical protein
VTKSLKQALAALGATGQVRVPADLTRPRPKHLSALLRAARDPRMKDWSYKGISWGVNVDWSEEAQGAVRDGGPWFVTTNADDEYEGIYALDPSTMDVLRRLDPPYDPEEYHTGALCLRNGVILVAVQGSGRGAWVTDTDFSESRLALADELPDGDMFAWCDINPHNGLVYTAAFDNPHRLLAYELSGAGLRYTSDFDIPLHGNEKTTHVQGGCFTPNFKWLAACDVDDAEELQCFSTLTGHLMGRRPFHTNIDEGLWRNEFESVWYTPGPPARVHLLELDNDAHSNDDFYLWHFALPGPDVL